MSAPFFIVGASRSGTTMLRLMLNTHSRLAVPDEMKYFRHVEGQYDLASWRIALCEDDYRGLVQQYLDTRKNVFPEGKEALDTLLAEDDRTIRGPYRSLLAHWTKTYGKERWGEKTPHNIFYVDVLADMFPDAQFIHVVRDPRAVVQSMNASSYYSDETVFNALNWRKSIRDGQCLFQQHCRPDQFLTVRYEDLVLNAESALRRVCAFLGEHFEPQILRFYETAGQQMAGQINTPSIQRPVSRAGLSKWRRRLTKKDIQVIEHLCRREMAAFDYRQSAKNERSPLPLLASPKLLYWQWKTWRHRDRRGFEVKFPFLSGLRARIRSCLVD